ncbi:MAG: hypothetical protein ACMG6E_06320 [Candidatus Roizmanbacteria bacterium]
MEAFLFNLRLEGIGVSVDDGINGLLSFLVVFNIGAVIAVALGTTSKSVGKAIAVELQALRFLAVAYTLAVGALVLRVGNGEWRLHVG